MSHQGEDFENMEGYPSLEILMQKTEKITKKIQELLLSAQERKISRWEIDDCLYRPIYETVVTNVII